MSYRKLSELEVKSMLGKYAQSSEVRRLADSVKKQYPKTVTFAIYTDSDYNDEYYINERRVMAFDAEGMTLGVIEIGMPRTDDCVESEIDRLYTMADFDAESLPALYVQEGE